MSTPETMSETTGQDVVTRYLAAVAGHDWDALADCLTDDVTRVGPFGDRYHPRDAYLTFLRGLLPSLEGYRMRVDRIVDAGRVVTAELTETLVWEGKLVVTPESLIFDLAEDGRISHIGIYIRRLAD